MAGNKQAIKARIRTISSTKKITGAMELIAISKLKRQRTMLERNREYAKNLRDTVVDILSNSQTANNSYLLEQEDTHPVTIIFSSDIGLCGGYNVNMLKAVIEQVAITQEIILIGARNQAQLISLGYQLNPQTIHSDMMNYEQLAKLTAQLLDRYQRHEITGIRVFYTRFVNSMHFEPCLEQLLPIQQEADEEKPYTEIIYEPNAEVILNDLIPMYVKSRMYTAWLETTTSEQSSRRLAMDQANDNAEELIEQLTLEFNRARQAAITQEINEIVSAADAL